ncbi:MAG: hypothetical protein WAM14_10025 [Candidatus Nitrosopolaris sp.]
MTTILAPEHEKISGEFSYTKGFIDIEQKEQEIDVRLKNKIPLDKEMTCTLIKIQQLFDDGTLQ